MSPTSELLPEPLDARDADEQAQGKGDVDVLEVVVPGAADGEQPAVGRFALLGNRRSSALPERYWPVRLSRDFARIVERPLGDDLAPLDAGAGAEIDEVVGGAHGVFIVLDDDDRVAHVARAAAKVAIRRSLSRGCRPMEGSSRM